jgi:hypothetical protein
MPLDIFALRDRVVGEYRSYAESFVHIKDARLDEFVRKKLAEGRLWPDAASSSTPPTSSGQRSARGGVDRETAAARRPSGRRYRLLPLPLPRTLLLGCPTSL